MDCVSQVRFSAKSSAMMHVLHYIKKTTTRQFILNCFLDFAHDLPIDDHTVENFLGIILYCDFRTLIVFLWRGISEVFSVELIEITQISDKIS